MALEDLAMFRAIPGSTVFYPSDAVSTEKAVELAANTPGICFIRSSRPNVPVIYANDEKFSVGKAKVTSKLFTIVNILTEILLMHLYNELLFIIYVNLCSICILFLQS